MELWPLARPNPRRLSAISSILNRYGHIRYPNPYINKGLRGNPHGYASVSHRLPR